MWANCSGRSPKMSDVRKSLVFCANGSFAQVAHDKWANEGFAQKILAKKSKILFFSMFYIRFSYLKQLAICSFPHFWRAMWANRSGRSPKMSESLRSLTKNEWLWANRLFLEGIAHSLIFFAKNERFAQKTDKRIPSPVSNPPSSLEWVFISLDSKEG